MKLRLYYTLALLLLISTVTLGQTATQAPQVLVSDTIPFALSEHNNIVVRAIVNGVDTVFLMFHTAANDVSLITSSADKTPSVAWDQSSDVQSWGGKSEARFSSSNTLEIGKSNWTDLAIWEGKNSGPTTDGKFGPNLFENHAIELDFDNHRLIIHPTLPAKLVDFEKVPLTYENDLMFIEGTSSIGDQEYRHNFLIHSGYSGALLYDDAFSSESKIGERIKITSEQELKDSYGNVLTTKKGTLPQFSIGANSFDNVPVGFFEGSIGRQKMSVIGGELLKRFH